MSRVLATTAAGIQFPLMIKPAGWSPATYWLRACCVAKLTCVDDKQAPVRTIWSDGRAGGGLVGLAASAIPPNPRTSGSTMTGRARNFFRCSLGMYNVSYLSLFVVWGQPRRPASSGSNHLAVRKMGVGVAEGDVPGVGGAEPCRSSTRGQRTLAHT